MVKLELKLYQLSQLSKCNFNTVHVDVISKLTLLRWLMKKSTQRTGIYNFLLSIGFETFYGHFLPTYTQNLIVYWDFFQSITFIMALFSTIHVPRNTVYLSQSIKCMLFVNKTGYKNTKEEQALWARASPNLKQVLSLNASKLHCRQPSVRES